MAMQFVNKLDGNQVLILSKVIHEFIKDIQDKYVSINDYILKTSFDELQGTYNVLQQQEKKTKSLNKIKRNKVKCYKKTYQQKTWKKEKMRNKT